MNRFSIAGPASVEAESIPRSQTGRIRDWSADSPVRAFLASDQVRADKAVRAPVSSYLESALAPRESARFALALSSSLPYSGSHVQPGRDFGPHRGQPVAAAALCPAGAAPGGEAAGRGCDEAQSLG